MRIIIIAFLILAYIFPALAKEQIELVQPKEGEDHIAYFPFIWNSVEGVDLYKFELMNEKMEILSERETSDTLISIYGEGINWKLGEIYYWRVCPVTDTNISCSENRTFKYNHDFGIDIINPKEGDQNVELTFWISWLAFYEGYYYSLNLFIYKGDSLVFSTGGDIESYNLKDTVLEYETKYKLIVETTTTNKKFYSDSITFTTKSATGIVENSAFNSINIFPQPVFSGDVLTIAAEAGEGAALKLYNLMGIELNVAVQREGDKLLLQTAGLAPGVYILEVGGVRKKVVVM